jgi:predicted nucleic acid-binding Zn ribbon protein
MEASAGSQQSTRNCVSCGRSIMWDANVCPYCGHDFRGVMQPQQAAKKESAMPLIGGILIIIGGVIELIAGAALAAGGSALLDITFGGSGFLVACGIIYAIVGLVAILGGIFAIQRRSFGLAIVGGIFALGGYFIPGLIGLILVAVSRDEFK